MLYVLAWMVSGVDSPGRVGFFSSWIFNIHRDEAAAVAVMILGAFDGVFSAVGGVIGGVTN